MAFGSCRPNSLRRAQEPTHRPNPNCLRIGCWPDIGRRFACEPNPLPWPRSEPRGGEPMHAPHGYPIEEVSRFLGVAIPDDPSQADAKWLLGGQGTRHAPHTRLAPF